MNPVYGELLSKNTTRRISAFISPADSMPDMELAQDEFERAMRDVDRKLALPDDKFEKYARDLLERAVKGLRRSS
jgi:hypothetical protein